jgi:TPP-dependent pyruvate/acetoin dehydrogenase alpha subunit
VWVFLGDGGIDESWFYESWRYSVGHDLPIYFVVEDNNRSVCTTRQQRWGIYDGDFTEKV